MIAVAKIDTCPDRGGGDRLVRPCAVGQINLLKGPVLSDGAFLHAENGFATGVFVSGFEARSGAARLCIAVGALARLIIMRGH